MSIKDLIKRKAKHPYDKVHKDSKDKRIKTTTRRDPWRWCDADEGLLDDPTIYTNVDTENMIVKTVTVEGELIDQNLDINEMIKKLEQWSGK